VKNAADFEADSGFLSESREKSAATLHIRNNCICHHFKQMMTVPTLDAIRPHFNPANYAHLKLWIGETFTDGENWQEVHNQDPKESRATPMFTVEGAAHATSGS
jgi:hypothetical protein